MVRKYRPRLKICNRTLITQTQDKILETYPKLIYFFVIPALEAFIVLFNILTFTLKRIITC